MTEYLIFSLVAPMGSFGDLAGHEWRGSHYWPGRSAVIGIVGSALGLRRDDKEGQSSLSKLNISVSVLSVSEVWRDFHTVQTVKSSRIKRPQTRRAALDSLHPSDNGLITWREYCSDCAFGVALSGGNIQQIKKAMNEPVFTPFLGRKSCPLSAPMCPKIVTAKTPVEALARISIPWFMEIDPSKPQMITSDEHIDKGWIETRWDVPLDREKWHFSKRSVYIYRSGR